MDLPLRASNEGLRRPRVARAQKTISPHPTPFIVRVLRARRAPGHSLPCATPWKSEFELLGSDVHGVYVWGIRL